MWSTVTVCYRESLLIFRLFNDTVASFEVCDLE
jgi:hypothetical protein